MENVLSTCIPHEIVHNKIEKANNTNPNVSDLMLSDLRRVQIEDSNEKSSDDEMPWIISTVQSNGERWVFNDNVIADSF